MAKYVEDAPLHEWSPVYKNLAVKLYKTVAEKYIGTLIENIKSILRDTLLKEIAQSVVKFWFKDQVILKIPEKISCELEITDLALGNKITCRVPFTYIEKSTNFTREEVGNVLIHLGYLPVKLQVKLVENIPDKDILAILSNISYLNNLYYDLGQGFEEEEGWRGLSPSDVTRLLGKGLLGGGYVGKSFELSLSDEDKKKLIQYMQEKCKELGCKIVKVVFI